MYLKEDITGAATGIVYGRKGDKVTILSESVELYFCELNGQKFYGRKEKFSTEEVSPESKRIDKTHTTSARSNRVSRLAAKQRRRI